MEEIKNNMFTPLVSIVIPAYNASTTLPRTLDSVLAQTYAHLDVIVINDGSQDITLNIATAYAQKDNRIRVINQENKGSSLTRRVGVENAKGTHLFFIDADDTIEANTIETLVSYAQKHPQAEAIETGYRSVTEAGEVKKVRQRNNLFVGSGVEVFQQQHFMFILCGKLFRLDFLKAHLDCFVKGMAMNEDLLFFLLNRLHIKQMVITPTAYYNYYVTPNSIVNTIQPWQTELLTFEMLWKHLYSLMPLNAHYVSERLYNSYERLRASLFKEHLSFAERQKRLKSLPHIKGSKIKKQGITAIEKFRLWLFLNKHFTLFHLLTYYRCYF